MARIPLLFQLLSCLVLAYAVDITGQIVWNDVCQNSTFLGQSTASLDEGVFHGSITGEGKFTIPDVPDGTYLLSIISHDYAFEQVRIDVANASSIPVEVRPYVVGTPMSPLSNILLSYPISLSPKEKYVYFVPPESFNLAGMFANPMMLLMVGGGVMMFAMPYLMKNMDPEALEEFKAQHAKLGGIQNALQSGDIKSGLSQMIDSGEEPAGPSSSKGTAGKTRQGGKKGKR